MILLCVPAAYFVFVPYQIKDLSQAIVAAVAFMSNFFFYLETDYFNEFTNKSPLLHTWTLSVEEQFYLGFPLLMLGVHRAAPRLLTPVLVTILIASFACAVYLTETNPILSFYATHTRAWELMAGALVAIHQGRLRGWIGAGSGAAMHRQSVELAVVAALVVILACVFTFSEKTSTPSVSTVLPVAGTGIILLLGADASIVRRLLSSRPMVSIGKLSYSLYIFHQPVNSFLHYSSFGEAHANTPQLFAASLLITVTLSLLSYTLVERPIRYSAMASRRRVFAGAAIMSLLLVAIGYQGNKTDGLRAHMVAKYSKAGNVLLVDVDEEKKRVGALARRIYWQYNTDFDSPGTTRILVMGDSMANDAFLSLIGLQEKLTKPHYSVRALRVDDECMKAFQKELQLSANGKSACLKDPDLPETNLQSAKALVSGADIILMTAIWQESTYEDAYQLARYLGDVTSAKVLVVGTMLFNDTTSIALKFAQVGMRPQDSHETMFTNLRFDRLRISDKLRSLVLANPRLQRIEKREHLCDMPQRRCTVFYDDGNAMIRDGAHFTVRAYDAFGAFLLRQAGVGGAEPIGKDREVGAF